MNPASTFCLLPSLLLACAGMFSSFFIDSVFAGAESTSSSASENSGSTETGSSAVENSVVKVFSTVRYPDPYKPWTKQGPTEISSSGIIIEGHRILCNAHGVIYASQVQVQPNQSGDKISATVTAIAPGIDLALLKLDDESCFETHKPIPRAKSLPDIKDTVMVYGYPKGGTSLSITKGIVSRIEFTAYNFPISGLRIQIDAAINSGNSGGPAVVNDQLIGLAFSHLGNADNIGYIIPCEEIELFLKDTADGRFDGKPMMFDELQTLENPAVRAFLKLDKSVQGVIVHKPDREGVDSPLKKWDVLTKIGGVPIDDEGMVKAGPNLRVNFRYLIQKQAQNNTVTLDLVREGKELHVNMVLGSKRALVIPDLAGTYPSYFVFGPLVFSSASLQYLAGFSRGASGAAWLSALGSAGSPLLKRLNEPPAFPNEHLVLISSPFFPHKLAKGYGNPASQVVKSINGIAIKNLEHLVELLRDSRDAFITIECDCRPGEAFVFNRAEMVASTEEILTDNGLRSQGSPDTMKIWSAKESK